jgi:hypothetical protein
MLTALRIFNMYAFSFSMCFIVETSLRLTKGAHLCSCIRDYVKTKFLFFVIFFLYVNCYNLLLNIYFVEIQFFSCAWTPQYIQGTSEHNARARDECTARPFLYEEHYGKEERICSQANPKYILNCTSLLHLPTQIICRKMPVLTTTQHQPDLPYLTNMRVLVFILVSKPGHTVTPGSKVQ